jgi:hypothetical protein
MRRLIAPLVLLGLEAAVLVVVVYVAPGRAALAAHVFVVVVAGEVLGAFSLALARSLRTQEPSVFEQGLRQEQRRPERVAQLVRLENEVALARQSAWDLHIRLVPTLREIAAGLLASRHGVSLDRDPDRASELLGLDAWSLVRPDRPPPEHRHDPGIDPPTLDRALTALEQLC